MPRSTKVGDQWTSCDRCGILTPMGRLVVEDGFKLCDRHGCRDNPLKKDDMQERLIARILNNPHEEATDRRNKLYFQPSDWDVI